MPSIKGTIRPVRYRVRLSRAGAAASLTHLAQIEALRRAVIGSGLPAAVDERRRRVRPKLAFGPAISMGYASKAEYFDMELTESLSPERVAEGLKKALGGGFLLEDVRRIPAFYPSLDASINVADYEISGPFPQDGPQSLERFLEQDSIVIKKIKQGGARIEEVEARPLIREMTFLALNRLNLSLRFGPKRTIKPEALLQAWLGAAFNKEFQILRKDLMSETLEGRLLKP
jgi:radical SAM-linked protein